MFETCWSDNGLGLIARAGARHPRVRVGGPDLFCAPGYHPSGGRCVPDTLIHCAPGTVVDPATNRCRPVDPILCPNGLPPDPTGRCVRMPVDPVCVQIGTAADGSPIWGGGPGCPQTSTPYPGFGTPGTNSPPGTPLPVPFVQPPISQDYINKYTAKFGRAPLMPGRYTGAFKQDWSASPGGPGIPDATSPNWNPVASPDVIVTCGPGYVLRNGKCELDAYPPLGVSDVWDNVTHLSGLAGLILSGIAIFSLMRNKKGRKS